MFCLNVPFLLYFILEIFISFVIVLSSNSTSVQFYNNATTDVPLKILNLTHINNGTELEEKVGASSTRHERKYKIGQRYTGRSRTYKRERHRHSTRVFIQKPVNYLLPPLESHVKVQYNNKQNQRSNQSNQKISKIRNQKIIRRKLLPRNNTKFVTSKPNISARVSNFVLPPSAFLLPPYEDRNDFTSTITALFTRSTSTELYTTLVTYPEYITTTQTVPLNYTADPFIEPPTIYTNYTENYYSSTENYTDYFTPTLDEKLDVPTYTPLLQNEENQNENINNFNLLSNDVAQLGMKVMTSEKGIEMLKQYHHVDNNNVLIEKKISNDQFSLVSNLATAESGDFWRNDYNKNQFLTEKPVTVNYSLVRNPYKICKDKLGYVADLTSGCQVFYICVDKGVGEPMLCPNGTLFNQDFLVCDWWYNVDCV